VDEHYYEAGKMTIDLILPARKGGPRGLLLAAVMAVKTQDTQSKQ